MLHRYSKRGSTSMCLWAVLALLSSATVLLWPYGEATRPAEVQGPPAVAARPATHFVNIEDIRVGDRVVTDATYRNEPADTQVDSRTWRKVQLIAREGEHETNVETLQSPEWLKAVDAQVGNLVPIPLDLVEMGLPEDFNAEVVDISPCPQIRAGPGRVVLTTVNHTNATVLELTVEDERGRQETIRPTGFHKFYSEDRGWVSARDLRLGERLGGVDAALRVVGIERIPGCHRVYNLTVEGEHVYYVSPLTALVHNNNCAPKRTPGGRTLTDHAIDRMNNPPRGRAPMTGAEVDEVLNTANKIKKISPHPKGNTITVQNTKMPGKPQVVVDVETGQNVITVIKNRPK